MHHAVDLSKQRVAVSRALGGSAAARRKGIRTWLSRMMRASMSGFITSQYEKGPAAMAARSSGARMSLRTFRGRCEARPTHSAAILE